MINASRIAASLAVFTVIGIALVVAQPSLTPPAGPIEVSGRFGTLIEINEQNTPGDGSVRHIISEPGSYVLTGNADAGSRNGIRIDSDSVTLDLNGYTINGTGIAGGIVPPAQFPSREIRGVTVRNGRIDGFERGILGRMSNLVEMADVKFANTLISDIEIRATSGIDLEFATIENCRIIATSLGIGVANSTIRDTTVRMIGAEGQSFRAGMATTNCNVVGCTVDMSGSGAITTFAYSAASTLFRGCHASGAVTGFSINTGSVATDCYSNSATNTLLTGAQTFNSNF